MTKQELRDYRYLLIQVRQLDDQIRWWRSRAEHSTRAPDRTPVIGGDTDPYPHIMDKIAECERVRDGKIAKLGNIETVFAGLDERESALMRAYYVDGLRWDQVANLLGYSVQHAWRLHGAILQKMRETES